MESQYASMEKDQLISMIHFLVKREDGPTNEARVELNSFELNFARRRKNIIQRAQENQDLKDMVKDLRDTHKQDVKTQTNREIVSLLCPMTIGHKRSISDRLLLTGRKNMLPMTIGIKNNKV